VARKNILTGLTGSKLTAVNSPTSSAPALTKFAARGAPGSISRSIGEIAAKATAAKALEAKLTAGQTVVELDAALIDASFIADRMPVPDDDAYEALKKAIADEGQGSPILVRPHPTAPGRYQVAFGHRRLRVARDLNRPVRAVIKTLSDQELILAQGQENSVRADLSFIERARFAQRMVELDYGRDVVMSALAVDKTTVSRMLSVTTRIPSPVIEAIGPAPAIGRDRWLELAGHFEAKAALPVLEEFLEGEAFCTAASDDRFNLIADLLVTGEGAAPRSAGRERGQERRHDVQTWAPSQGNTVITLKHHARSCVMNIDQRQAPGLGDFLLRHMERLYREYQTDRQDR
jgi:ParB family transcriptional regulator, chromosome partitioning protein